MLGVIGGSGLYELPGIEGVQRTKVATPFGDPSDELITGRLGDVDVAFLPRHGRGHTILPSEINFRANIYALKKLGADFLVSVGAVGSLRKELAHRATWSCPTSSSTERPAASVPSFGDGIVAHVSLADPVCSVLAGLVGSAATESGGNVHTGVAHTSVWRDHSSRRAPSPTSTASGAPTSSV